MFTRILIAAIISLAFSKGNTQYITNPILAGYYPDPSICRVNNDYYIVNSSFAYFPGLPIFHSTDLVNWQQISYALHTPQQLNLDGERLSGGLYAPAISYHQGIFYIVCTEVGKLGNFVITAKDPRGPWSNPVPIPEVNGIDPSLFFDDNNKAYIVYNSIPPNNQSLYEGHRTIRMYPFDTETLKVSGDEILLINGGTDISQEPVWIEGPHIFKKDDWYYLFCAEGGTGYNHSEVVFRSKAPTGPYISYENNPVLTQRQLNPERKNPITSAGHADLIQTPNGDWWSVFLACRPYAGDYYNTGRETFITPVIWENGWPVFNPGHEEIQYTYPVNAARNESKNKYSGNFTFKDNFSEKVLDLRYRLLRTPREEWYNFTTQPGALTIQLRPETVRELSNPSFIGFHQPHLKGYAATSMSFKPTTANEKAGLLVFQNEKAHYFLCKTVYNNQMVIELYKEDQLIKRIALPKRFSGDIKLKAEANNDTYIFYYALKKHKWKQVAQTDAKPLSTKSAGGFVGTLYAMYATSEGNHSINTASFNWFEVKNNDAVYFKNQQ